MWYGSKAGDEKEEKIQEFVSGGTFGFISCGYICMDGGPRLPLSLITKGDRGLTCKLEIP